MLLDAKSCVFRVDQDFEDDGIPSRIRLFVEDASVDVRVDSSILSAAQIHRYLQGSEIKAKAIDVSILEAHVMLQQPTVQGAIGVVQKDTDEQLSVSFDEEISLNDTTILSAPMSMGAGTSTNFSGCYLWRSSCMQCGAAR